MRYHVKGGIWKNTEDEILKAAVMKYGLNQWSRISSLLVRKSAKQCKERWYEWLDPQIKKTEWTRDEEEKLLHLAKMFPCQWRTIAPIVGRTAYQCLEHYEKLLDRAQGRDTEENDPRRLRPGEIDPNPETKPARPDPIDMDEDEKETLNEARARLANTRGKKAKRKAREKQLEEARRLAALQKKRELKSAGIDVVLRLPRKKKKEMNYNLDVPFMRKVPEGSFKAGTEETPAPNKFKGAISLQFLENRNRDEEEEKFRKIDDKRMKNLKQKNLPEALDKINKMNDPANILLRNKLNLPEPQVTDKELEGISKLTATGLIDSMGLPNRENNNFGDYSATKVLMGDYTTQRTLAPNSTFRTPKVEDHVMKEAKIAISLIETDTPLIGGQNAIEDLKNYMNYKKTEANRNNFKTPGPIPTPQINHLNMSRYTNLSQNNNNNLSNTKLTNSLISEKTPLRDEMNINMSDENPNAWENSIVNASNSFNEFNKPLPVKFLLSNLPKPQNKYEIDFTDNTQQIEKEIIEQENKEKIPEDAEDVKAKNIYLQEQKEKLESLHQTQAVQRDLPRPSEINYNYRSYDDIKMSVSDEEIENFELIQRAEELINHEMKKLLEYDAINHPVKGNKIPNHKNFDVEMELEEHSLEEKHTAKELIREEMENLYELNKENKDFVNIDSLKDFSHIWKNTLKEEVFYIPDVNMFFHIGDMEKSKKFDALQESFNIEKNIFNKDEIISKKLEEKAAMLTKGYLKRFQMFMNKYKELTISIQDLKTQVNVYKELKCQEDKAIRKRQDNIEEENRKLKLKQNELQLLYKKYQEKIEELEKI
jgi:pre-mRNA-splicing factor CDC5/CEF1